uniref:Protein pelota homolog n=1 Tax=Panagrellus redivivus TaxID=6233 RepID=A0A7E4V8G4_PANRE
MRVIDRIPEVGDVPAGIVMECQTQDDLWHLYNIIRLGDLIQAFTDRKVHDVGDQITKFRRKLVYRVTLEMQVAVTSVHFDPLYDGLHVSGLLLQEFHPLVAIDRHHTMDIRVNTVFLLSKACWDSIDLERIEKAVAMRTENVMAAVVLHEGVAQICVITENMTVVKAKIEMQVARKRAGFVKNHEKSVKRFLETVAKAFMRHIVVDDMKAVIVAGRGFLHTQFLSTLYRVAEQSNVPFKVRQKSKFFCVNVSSGYKHSVKEILSDPATAALLADTAAHEEMKAINEFMDLFNNDPARAFYGYKHVTMANAACAIDTLMVSDALFRSNDVEKRKQYIKLVEAVQDKNGKVLIFSSLHVSGEQLNQITGVAAILRFPMPELEDEEMDEDEVEEDNNLTVKVDEYVVREFPGDVDATVQCV